ncbi:TetR family transcriptional regulator [Rhodococcus triatomae]|uniref:DNA-binding transcriptional regulator YbjK n=1 Tax=Rhodococcus triatomae TaxID=300028 RepID=A0A1G8B6J9_9NOCA|nr:TetR family transcriptional regulator C-terminal domain-containing protein [Rhodococcus triatomae]QNG17563.1 TetR family transcriptional regulator [Rhodococcus triatomae]QNG22769.1 TetR family transcriptional regulator [Rhodococcus triatomae]SDH28859.1 DNA-binding transcriptional regulator YbjK [Rhodococcus triatomae]
MPKLIDHDERQQLIAEAVWRVIVRDGVSAVSVREVAAEAGLSSGSLRHVFPSKSALVAYSMQLVHDRVRERIRTRLEITDPRSRALAICEEMLPLDDRRRCEMEVNLALIAESPGHPDLRRIALDAHHALREGCFRVLTDLSRHGLFDPERDVGAEALRLHALLDGLAMHLVLGENDSPDAAAGALAAHLDSLAHPESPGPSHAAVSPSRRSQR